MMVAVLLGHLALSVVPAIDLGGLQDIGKLQLGELSSPVGEAQLPPLKSDWLALGLTAAVEVPTLLVGPSLGHLYAGESLHFWLTGAGRLADLFLLYVLATWVPNFGLPPLYAVLSPGHLGASFAAYPLAFPIDLLLVLAWFGSGVYDFIDSFFAARRYNRRTGRSLPIPAVSKSFPASPWPGGLALWTW